VINVYSVLYNMCVCHLFVNKESLIITEQVEQYNKVFSVQRVTLRGVSTINKSTTSYVYSQLPESEAVESDVAFGRTRCR